MDKIANWGRTMLGERRLALADKIVYRDMVPYYNGRHVIGRDTPIDGGVYIGSHEREAITVDSNSPEVQRLYGIARNMASIGEFVVRPRVLKAIYETVGWEMPSNPEGVRDIIKELDVGEDKEISLDYFIKAKSGLCRDHALACTVLVEMFKKEGILRGKVSVDRNSLNGRGHAWCRYTSFEGNVHILDVSKSYFGKLKRASEAQRLRYCRKEDKV